MSSTYDTELIKMQDQLIKALKEEIESLRRQIDKEICTTQAYQRILLQFGVTLP